MSAQTANNYVSDKSTKERHVMHQIVAACPIACLSDTTKFLMAWKPPW